MKWCNRGTSLHKSTIEAVYNGHKCSLQNSQQRAVSNNPKSILDDAVSTFHCLFFHIFLVYLCLRALEKLQEICQSLNRRNRFSESAMTALLNSNLPVKYSMTGHLASTDIMTTGFYDAGKVCYLLYINYYRFCRNLESEKKEL